MNMMSPIRQPEMPAFDALERIKQAAARMGDAMGIDGQFRFAYGVTQDGRSECFLIHAFKPDEYATAEKAVVVLGDDGRAFGSLDFVLAALERYVAERAPVLMAAE